MRTARLGTAALPTGRRPRRNKPCAMEPAPRRQLPNEPSGDRPGGLFYAMRFPGFFKAAKTYMAANATTATTTDRAIVFSTCKYAPRPTCFPVGISCYNDPLPNAFTPMILQAKKRPQIGETS